MHDHDHDHDHGHDHGHHERPASQSELRARALEALLVERGLVSTDAIDAVVEYYENDVGPQNGATRDRARLGRSRVPRAAAQRRQLGDRRARLRRASRASTWSWSRTRRTSTT